MEARPSIPILIAGIIRVASTLAGIIILGVAIDLLLMLPHWPPDSFRLLGFVPITLGVILEVAGTLAFWTYGSGTPNPVTHPQRLVTLGPYSWSRHPLYLARHLVLLGASWLFGSPSILVLTFFLFVVVERVMIPREEQRLSDRFGPLYEEYRARVSRWVTIRRRSPR